MKKIITGILALALAGAASLPALAVTNDGTAGTPITVEGEFISSSDASTVISVDIAWDSLEFIYQDGDKTWDPTKHQNVASEGAWETDTKTITMTNHSNAPIKATLSFVSDASEITGTFDKSELMLPTAENTDPASAPADSAEFGISGGRIDADCKIGTITVSVAKDDAAADDDPDTTVINSVEELAAAVVTGGKFRLGSDLEPSNMIRQDKTYAPLELNLGKKTILASIAGEIFEAASTMTIKNGTIHQTYSGASAIHGSAITTATPVINIENCTLIADSYYTLYLTNTTATVKDCVITSGSGKYAAITLSRPEAKLTLKGNITLNGWMCIDAINGSTVICEAGTYNFDPTQYVDTEAYTVTNDGSLWTVTAK